MSPTINNEIKTMKQETKNLKKIVFGFAVTTILLVGSVFGVSIATARLTKDFSVDPKTGFALARSTSQILKTELAITRGLDFSPVAMENEALGYIEAITLEGGDIRFHTLGHARDSVKNVVTMIVQGGTITFDSDGVERATGDPVTLLEEAGILEPGTGRRELRLKMLAKGSRNLSDGGVSKMDIHYCPHCPWF